MISEAELIVDRRRLKRSLTWWRIAAVLLAVAAIVALIWTPGNFKGFENHIARTLGSKAAARFANARLLADKFHNPLLRNQMRISLLRRMWDLSEFMKGFKSKRGL